MSTDWGTADVKCPFYKKEDPIRIVCEGISAKSVCHNIFHTGKGKLNHKKRYCNTDNYKECILFQALLRKY